jgi:uncharacterized membrane protein
LLHEILHFFGRAICHQLGERSLIVSGEALAVCARDTGIYIGIFSTLFYLHFTKRKQSITIPSIKISLMLLLFLVPLIIDGLGSYTNLFESNNLRRLLTGIAFGFVLPYFIYPLLSKKSLEHGSVPVLGRCRDLFIPLVLSIFLGGLFYWGQPSHIIIDSFIIFTVISWFSIMATFLVSFIHRVWVRITVSVFVSLSFLSILSFANINIL